MASTAVDRALIAAAEAAIEANREVKRERARAMDAIVDLLLWQAEARALLRDVRRDYVDQERIARFLND